MSAFINIPKYKLSPNEVEALLKEEREKRKKFRIIQVRHQSREIAADIRNAVKTEKDHQYQLLSEHIQLDFNEEKENCLQDLESEYQQNLEQIGQSHFLAQQQDDSSNARELQNIKNTVKENDRYKQALRKRKEQNALKQYQFQRHIIDRQTALEVEATRTAIVVNLPTSKEGTSNKDDKPVAGHKVQMQDVNALVPTLYQMPEKCVIRQLVKSQMDARKMAQLEEQKLTQKTERPDKSQERFKQALHRDRLNKPSVKVKEAKLSHQEDLDEVFEQLSLENQVLHVEPSSASIQPEGSSNLYVPSLDQPVKEQPEKKNQQIAVNFNNLHEIIRQQKEEMQATTNQDSPELESASLVAEPKSSELGIVPKSDELPNDLTSSISSTVYFELPDKPSIPDEFREKYFDKVQVVSKSKTFPLSNHREVYVVKYIIEDSDVEISPGKMEPLQKAIPCRKLVMTTEESSESRVDYKQNWNIFQEAEDQLKLLRQHNELFKDSQQVLKQQQRQINTPQDKSQLSEVKVQDIRGSSHRNLKSQTNNERIMAKQKQLLQRHRIKQLMKTTISQPSRNFLPSLGESFEMGQGDTGNQSETNLLYESNDDLRRPHRTDHQSETNQPCRSNNLSGPHKTLSENEINLKVYNRAEAENRTPSWCSQLKLLQAQPSAADAMPFPHRHVRPPPTSRIFFQHLPPHELSTIIEIDTPINLSENSDTKNSSQSSMSTGSFHDFLTSVEAVAKNQDILASNSSILVKPIVSKKIPSLFSTSPKHIVDKFVFKEFNVVQMADQKHEIIYNSSDNIKDKPQFFQNSLSQSFQSDKQLNKFYHSMVDYSPLLACAKPLTESSHTPSSFHSQITNKTLSPLSSGTFSSKDSLKSSTVTSTLSQRTITSTEIVSDKINKCTPVLGDTLPFSNTLSSDDKTMSTVSQYSCSSSSLSQFPLDNVVFRKPLSNSIHHSTSKDSLTDSNCINFSASTDLTFLSNSASLDHRMAMSWSQSSINSGINHRQALPAPKLQQQQLKLSKVHSTPLKNAVQKLDTSGWIPGILEESDLTLVNSSLDDVTQYPMLCFPYDQFQGLPPADSTKKTDQFKDIPLNESVSQSLFSFQSHE